MKRTAAAALVLMLLTAALGASGSGEELEPGIYARFLTNRGAMVFRLDYDRTPLAVTNFCGLAEGTVPNAAFAPGVRYFDGMEFYREAPDYAVFSGDPTGSGTGGPGYTLPRETGALISAGVPGVLVMDGYATESAGSRFFITQKGDAFLDTRYTAFGRIVSGERTLGRLRRGDVIESVEILRVGTRAGHLRFDEGAFKAYLNLTRIAEMKALETEDPALAAAITGLGDERAKTVSGIYYTVVTPGEGGHPAAGDLVSMHYTGTLLDGTVFDSSRPRGQTFDFTLGVDGVIPGWIEMVMDMTPGEVRQVVIPPSLAYGSQGYGPIEPDSWLVFEMELVGFTGE